MKKPLKILCLVLICALVGAGMYLNPLLEIITGYGAKNLASAVFVSGREADNAISNELNFSFIKYNKYIIDEAGKTITAKFLWGRSTAVYQDGYGCTLLRDFPEEDLMKRPAINPNPNADKLSSAYWPKGDRLSAKSFTEINYDKLSNAVTSAFGDETPYFGTRALVVVYKNQIIAEKYADGFSQSMPMLSWSMAKSVTNAMVGILVKDGLIESVDSPAPVKEWANDERAAISWSDLMRMSSGQEWNEDYGNLSDVTVMLHKEGDFGQFTLEKPLVDPIGKEWVYSSGSPNLICKLVKDCFDTDSAYYNFPYERLFKAIDMNHTVFETDASGIFVGSSYVYATARDFARFGMLYINNGYWLGQQILPDGWVDYTSTPAPASAGRYGAYFWNNDAQDFLPDVPRDCYFCRGHDGQMIFIIPSKDLVVVRLGYSPKGTFDFNLFLTNILDAVE